MSTAQNKIYYIKKADKEFLKSNYRMIKRPVAFWVREGELPPILYWIMEIPLFLLTVKNSGARLVFEDKDSLYDNEQLFSKVKNQISIAGISK